MSQNIRRILERHCHNIPFFSAHLQLFTIASKRLVLPVIQGLDRVHERWSLASFWHLESKVLGDVVWWSGRLDGWGKTTSRGVTRFGLGKASAVQIQQLPDLRQPFSLQKSDGEQSCFRTKENVFKETAPLSHEEGYGAGIKIVLAAWEIFLNRMPIW